jgi:hypothetical protein
MLGTPEFVQSLSIPRMCATIRPYGLPHGTPACKSFICKIMLEDGEFIK